MLHATRDRSSRAVVAISALLGFHPVFVMFPGFHPVFFVLSGFLPVSIVFSLREFPFHAGLPAGLLRVAGLPSSLLHVAGLQSGLGGVTWLPFGLRHAGGFPAGFHCLDARLCVRMSIFPGPMLGVRLCV